MSRFIFLWFIGGLISMSLISCAGEKTSESNTAASDKTTQSGPADSKTNEKKKSILFFGDSISAAYGLDKSEGYVNLVREKIDSLGLNYKVVNAGVSGETTAGGKGRIDWILKQPIDIFVLELGGNDALRGIAVESSYANLEYVIKRVKEKYPSAKVVLAGMQAPPNMGVTFTKPFAEMYPKLAKVHNTSLIPFILDGVGGIPSLNQKDGIHPTAEGHKILAENVWKVIKDLL